MCRFLLYLGDPVVVSDLITEPENSLIHQSFHSEEREEPLNGDGFGLAWYVHALSAHPGLFRSISPAWSNRNLHHLARITRSHCVLAHVRAASEASIVSETNCHPFSWGPFAFMHNGDVASFHELRRVLENTLTDATYNRLEGSTDSEFLFGFFLDRWHEEERLANLTERLAVAMQRTIHEVLALLRTHGVRAPSYLNLAVSDGHRAVVSRVTNDDPQYAESLHVHTGKVYHCQDGVSCLIEPGSKRPAVIVSSEKLSEDASWQTIPTNHLVVVSEDLQVQLRPIALTASAP